MQYLTYAPARWDDAAACHLRRAAITSGGQYSHRGAMLMSFRTITHSLGLSQDVNKRRRKLHSLLALPDAQRTEEQRKLIRHLHDELLLIGNAGRQRAAHPLRCLLRSLCRFCSLTSPSGAQSVCVCALLCLARPQTGLPC